MVVIVHGVVKPFKSGITLTQAVANHLALPLANIRHCDVIRRSIDARKRIGRRKEIKLVYNVRVTLDSESEIHVVQNGSARSAADVSSYQAPIHSAASSMKRPIVIGCGPAGLFAAYTLIQSGFKPVIIEQGPKVERRSRDLMNFWKHNILTPNSNGVFGEGGAGAFSDGKLTTRTSSPYHRFVHETLIRHGAKDHILYESRAHIGTDQLRKIISNFSREGIRDNGATFLYNTYFHRLLVNDGQVQGVQVQRADGLSEEEHHEWEVNMKTLREDGVYLADADVDVPGMHCSESKNGKESGGSAILQASHVFLATGHSARSVFDHLHAAGVAMTPKDFAMGLRLQVSQHAVNTLQYGAEDSAVTARELGAAEFTYKYRDKESDRVAYTFCMCPGGVVVNASHGGREVAVNGMSYSTRASRFANAAFVVTVGMDDFVNHAQKVGEANSCVSIDKTSGGDGLVTAASICPLMGMKFQQFWEQKCFGAGGATYSVPAQRAVDYIRQHESGRDFRFPRAATAAESQLQTRRRRELRDQGSTREVSHDLPDHIFMGSLRQSNLHDCLPDYVNSTLVKALMRFATAMPGLLTEDSLLMGIESRTSSPVRICRDSQTLESVNTKGLYPLGEGAGYAGGIMTACVDGVRAVEAMVLSTDPSHAGNYFQQQYKGDDYDNYPAW